MPSTLYVNRLVIVAPIGKLDLAHVETKRVDPAGGEKAFGVGTLSPSGLAPATHSWCSWQMTDDERGALEKAFVDGVNGYRVFDGNRWEPEEILAQVGLRRIGTMIGGGK